MMKSESPFGYSDEKIIDEDYIAVEGSVNDFGFCHPDKEGNPFKRDIFVPSFHLMKVHEGKPVRVYSRGYGHCAVYPVADLTAQRTPAEVYRDKEAYDAVFFALVPYAFEFEDKSRAKVFNLEKSFKWSDGSRTDASLFYVSHGIEMCSDCSKYSFISPSQTMIHLYHWLTGEREILSHSHTFEQKSEGRLEVSSDVAKNLMNPTLIKIMEERFGEKLTFSDD